MDIADEFQQIGIFLAQNRFVPVLEQVAHPVVAPIEVYGVTGEQFFHQGRNGNVAGSQQQMEMIWDQGPGEAAGAGFRQKFAQALQKAVIVHLIAKDRLPGDTPADDVVQRAGGVYAGLPGHERDVSNSGRVINLYFYVRPLLPPGRHRDLHRGRLEDGASRNAGDTLAVAQVDDAGPQPLLHGKGCEHVAVGIEQTEEGFIRGLGAVVEGRDNLDLGFVGVHQGL